MTADQPRPAAARVAQRAALADLFRWLLAPPDDAHEEAPTGDQPMGAEGEAPHGHAPAD